MTLPPNEAPTATVEEVVRRLTTLAQMIALGERIAYGSDSRAMEDAASLIASLQAELYLANNERENLKDALDREVGNGEKEAMHAEAAEARLSAVEGALEGLADAVRGSAGVTEGWQDISTAPRDGTLALLVVAGYKPVVGSYHADRGWDYQTEQDFAEESHWQEWLDRTGEWEPTHWMSLPTPPAAEEV